MRSIILLLIVLTFAQPVNAQCVDIPSCKGAEVESRLRGAQYVTQTAEARPTSTPRPTRIPPPTATETPLPKPTLTATEIPSTQTPQPVATMTVMPSVTEIVIMPTIAARVVKPEPLPLWIRIPLGIAAIVLILFAASGLRKPTTEQ